MVAVLPYTKQVFLHISTKLSVHNKKALQDNSAEEYMYAKVYQVFAQ